MGFRDDREALRARLEAAEHELEAAREENRALRAREELPGGPGTWFLGAPTVVSIERVVEGELPEGAQEELVEALRGRFQTLGQASRVGRSLAWTSASSSSDQGVEVSVAPRAGRTVVRVMERFEGLAGGLFGGVVGGLGGGGLGAVFSLAYLLRVPALLPFLIVGWVGAVYAIVRAYFRATVRRRAMELRAAADELAEIAEASVTAAPRMRVGDEPEGATGTDASERRGGAAGGTGASR